MSIVPGARLGSYEIVSAIGAGGMGEVYRARDTKLNRDVAIKVLPAAFAHDHERLARFTREAQTLASVNHPNIAAIYGIEESGPSTLRPGSGTAVSGRSTLVIALVMELVEGEDLSAHIARGPIPIAEALPIARQIAEALEAAHEQSIVHRDLKPANIKVRRDGTVKVLDFGLAKAMDPAGASNPNVSHSPTLTHQGTSAGMIIGTAAYMSPEQARGKTVDRRADIWAFGVVLYEMLTGTRLFAGETVSDTMAAVLTADPDWKRLPAGTPHSVERLVRRCLDRDVKHRLQSIAEARIVLEAPMAAETTRSSAAPSPSGSGTKRLLLLTPWLIATVAILGPWLGLWSGRGGGSASRPLVPTHVDVSFPPDIEPQSTSQSTVAISPDGRAVAIIAFRAGMRRMYVRRLASDDPFELAGTQGANYAAFSPDGGSLAFVNPGGLVVSLTLADQQRKVIGKEADLTGALAWGDPGIVFPRNGELWLAPLGGGAELALTKLEAARHETQHTSPVFLPGGRILFTSLTSEMGSERIEAVSLTGGPRTVVLERASSPLYSPTGHLVFARDGSLLASSFEPLSLKVLGAATSLIGKGGLATTAFGGLAVKLSASGDLVAAREKDQATRAHLVERNGSVQTLPFPRAAYLNPRVSPDDRRIMVAVAGLRLDAFDMDRQTMTRLTPEAPPTNWATWNRDGTAVIFKRYGAPYWISTDGSVGEGRVPGGAANDFLSGAGPDSDSFLCTRIRPTTSADIMLISRTGKFEPKPLIATPAYEGGAQLSPDGRFLVYASDESDQLEIQVRRYPSLEKKWRVSVGFGSQPRFRADGREIFYRDGQNMIAVPFDGSSEEPVIGKPITLFKDDYDFGQGNTIANYDVTKDGRFIMLRRDGGVSLSLVLNWTEELKEIMARGGVK